VIAIFLPKWKSFNATLDTSIGCIVIDFSKPVKPKNKTLSDKPLTNKTIRLCFIKTKNATPIWFLLLKGIIYVFQKS